MRLLSGLVLTQCFCALTSQGSGWVWNGHAGADKNWSTIANWTDPNVVDVLSAEPDDGLMKVNVPAHHGSIAMSEGDIVFDNGAANKTGIVTSVVNGNRTVGSLQFANTGTNIHTLLLESGKKLAVNGDFRIGEHPGANTLALLVGQATLSVSNPAAQFIIQSHEGNAKGGNATLDASGLDFLSVNVSNVVIGCYPGSRGSLILAATNLIQTRNLWLANKGLSATLGFKNGGSNSVVVIRGVSGDASRANVFIGDGSQSGHSHGTLDFGAATVEAMLGNVLLGYGGWNTPNVQGSGVLNLSAGVVDATTITLGQNLNIGQGLGMLNISGGVLRAKAIVMGAQADEWGATNKAIINLSGGTLQAATIAKGDSEESSRRLNWSAGTIQNYPGKRLQIKPFIDILLTGQGPHIIDVESQKVVTVSSPITTTPSGAAAGLTKTGGGLLLLNAANSFAGETRIAAGTFGGKGRISGGVGVNQGASLAPGDAREIGAFTAGGDVVLAGSLKIRVDAVNKTNSVLVVGGDLTLSDALLDVQLMGHPSEAAEIVRYAGKLKGRFVTVPDGWTVDYSRDKSIAIRQVAEAKETSDEGVKVTWDEVLKKVREAQPAPGVPSLSYSLDESGIAELTYGGQKLITKDAGRFQFSELTLRRPDGSTYAAKAGQTLAREGNTIHRTAPGQWDVTCTYRQEQDALLMDVAIKNLSTDTVTQISWAPSKLLLSGQNITVRTFNPGPFWVFDSTSSFGQSPSTFGGIPAMHIDYGSGCVAITDEYPDHGVILVPPSPQDLRVQVRSFEPIPAGSMKKYTLAYRFGPPKTDMYTLSKLAFQRYAVARPFQLQWDDRRAIIQEPVLANGIPATPENPHAYKTTQDLRTEAGKAAFRSELMGRAEGHIGLMKKLDAQGIVFWSIEGIEQMSVMYLGDPTRVALAPEMEYKDASGVATVDAFLKRFTDAGFRVGHCLRPHKLRCSTYEFGTQFKPLVNGSITRLRMRTSFRDQPGVHFARIWRNKDDTVVGGPYEWVCGGSDDWVELAIPPLAVTSNTEYTVSITTSTNEGAWCSSGPGESIHKKRDERKVREDAKVGDDASAWLASGNLSEMTGLALPKLKGEPVPQAGGEDVNIADFDGPKKAGPPPWTTNGAHICYLPVSVATTKIGTRPVEVSTQSYHRDVVFVPDGGKEENVLGDEPPGANYKPIGHTDLVDPAQHIIEMANYCKKRWGSTLFYVDSTVTGEPKKALGEDNREPGDEYVLDSRFWKRIQEACPDMLFMPENQSANYYPYSAPFDEGGHYVRSTPRRIREQWPGAFSAIHFDPLRKFNPGDPPLYAGGVKQGDILFVQPWRSDVDTARSIYQMAGSPPTARIIMPTNQTVLAAGAALTIDADADDRDGEVVKVEYYDGTLELGRVKLGECTQAPYRLTCHGLPPGRHVLSVRAVDDAGLERWSASVVVIIGD